MSNRTYSHLGAKVGGIVDAKNAAYGSSFARSGDFLRMLFPHGIAPERYGDALLLVRIFDKQMRIATDADAFGESPYLDIAGYGLLGAQQHEERMKQECASVRQQDAAAGSMEPNASAASDASRQTTANVEEPNARRFVQPSKPPCATTSEPTAAPAQNATENASVEEAVQLAAFLALGRRRNVAGLCAGCSRFFALAFPQWTVVATHTGSHADARDYRLCSKQCRDGFLAALEACL